MIPGPAQKCENCGEPFVEGDAIQIVKLCPKCDKGAKELFAKVISGRKIGMRKIASEKIEPDCRYPGLAYEETHSEPTAQETYLCPVCRFTDTEDVSPRADNGIIGPGHASWKLLDVRVCKFCGALFMPTRYNKRS